MLIQKVFNKIFGIPEEKILNITRVAFSSWKNCGIDVPPLFIHNNPDIVKYNEYEYCPSSIYAEAYPFFDENILGSKSWCSYKNDVNFWQMVIYKDKNKKLRENGLMMVVIYIKIYTIINLY